MSYEDRAKDWTHIIIYMLISKFAVDFLIFLFVDGSWPLFRSRAIPAETGQGLLKGFHNYPNEDHQQKPDGWLLWFNKILRPDDPKLVDQ